jgi:hypothetical protein
LTSVSAKLQKERVCVCEREREREIDRGREGGRERERGKRGVVVWEIQVQGGRVINDLLAKVGNGKEVDGDWRGGVRVEGALASSTCLQPSAMSAREGSCGRGDCFEPRLRTRGLPWMMQRFSVQRGPAAMPGTAGCVQYLPGPWTPPATPSPCSSPVSAACWPPETQRPNRRCLES